MKVNTRNKFIYPIFWSGLIIYTFYQTYLSVSRVRGWVSPKLKLLMIGYGVGFFVLWSLGMGAALFPDRFSRLLDMVKNWRHQLGGWSKSVSILFMLLPTYFIFYSPLFKLQTPLEEVVKFPHLRVLILLLSAITAAFFWTRSKEKAIDPSSLEIGLLASSVILILVREFQYVVDYPFTLTWSEGNRMWDYSILFRGNMYHFPSGKDIFAFIDRGRQSLWGLAFLIPGLPIWGMRLWDAFLFTIPYTLLGWMVIDGPRRGRPLWFVFGLWTLLFLNQGPIYTPLVLSAILVAGSRKVPFLLGLTLVALAGYYAQITRFTWLFAPGMWAGMWALGRAELERGRILKGDWLKSISLALAGVMGGYVIPIVQSGGGGPVSVEGVSQAVTHHPLLWSRLWPNPTFAPGILLGLLMAVGPLLVLLGHWLYTDVWRINFWQGAALGGSLLAFLVVGTIASVKIGGGSNLHNLDMFLIGLLFTAGVAWEKGGGAWLQERRFTLWQRSLILVGITLPVFFPLIQSTPLILPEKSATQEALSTVRQEVKEASGEGRVLFMDQRQLLTFGYVEQVPLVDDYEKKYVMNQALGDNQPYFRGFYDDLAEARFSLIVSEPLKVNYWDTRGHNFAEENNAWAYWVAEPMLCYYKRLATFKENRLELLVPREEARDCSQFMQRK